MLENKMTDDELANLVKESQNEEALSELINRHSGIFIDMVKKFGSKSLNETQLDDCLLEKDYMIYKTALEFDHEKSKFSTFLANKTKYMCLTQKSQNKRNKEITCFDEIEFCEQSNDFDPSESYLNNEDYSRMINLILKHKDEKVKTIFEERYFGGKKLKLKPWKQIAKKLNLSIQGCINIHNRTIKEFQKKIKDEFIKF